ncbi:hypothetical protein Taro_010315 [Colocasia esculenta]|uniref:Uncharacterized protein n=1 Tax=Colocasia esculenta TaxID=4460 RepID=A0A843U6K8_COLES|nr:hypothetical protein [Colocasia esculenta]
MGKTIAGVDESLQDQKWIRGPSEDRGNPPMPKSVESLQGRGFRSMEVYSRERERTVAWYCTCAFIGVGAKANVRNRKIEATAEIFRNHFSLACSPQSGMGIVYVKHRTNRMRINFSPRLSNNKGWTGRLFSVGRRKGANIPEWDFPVRVVEPLRKADMPPFLIKEAAAASQSLNTVGVNHAEGYLTEYKLVKCKLSRAWDDEEIAAGRDQKEMANYAEMIPVSLCSIRLDEGGSAKGPAQKEKAVARGGAVKEALETATTAGATSLPQTKRKEKCKAAVVESQAEGRTSEEEVSYEPRARKKKKATKSMLQITESTAVVEDEEEDLEPLLARSSCQRTGMP